MRGAERVPPCALDIIEVPACQSGQSAICSDLLYQSSLDIESLHVRALAGTFLNAVASQTASGCVSNGLNRHHLSGEHAAKGRQCIVCSLRLADGGPGSERRFGREHV